MYLAGEWSLFAGVPPCGELLSALASLDGAAHVVLDATRLGRWDSTLLLVVRRITAVCRQRALVIEGAELPESASALLNLAEGRGSDIGEGKIELPVPLVARIGSAALDRIAEFKAQLAFVGMLACALGAFVRGKARGRPGSLARLLQQCGPNAVPIITLISFLVGMILAFIGAVQLRQFGAQLYIADLVGLGMAKEMGAMMTAVIMAGRTGAAYAAELGSMRVNEETDALHTLGIDPMEFLVIPRILALVLAMPVLCIYADFMGIVGGAVVTAALFDISMLEYFNESRVWLHMSDFNVGIGKSVVFAVLVGAAGCMRGLRCGTSSSDVGYAATSAVVTSIVWVVVADAILTLLITTLNI
ncbi:ABC transporter permease [Methylogaea oryzae]|uniref:ABC transporter permease n=1 Tax=Methylogaea oryzae TaxID=1295382 RepID=A0A8D4VU38_9GAMM|nr:ABC transporter permease [Methylogaea oryzae]